MFREIDQVNVCCIWQM